MAYGGMIVFCYIIDVGRPGRHALMPLGAAHTVQFGGPHPLHHSARLLGQRCIISNLFRLHGVLHIQCIHRAAAF